LPFTPAGAAALPAYQNVQNGLFLFFMPAEGAGGLINGAQWVVGAALCDQSAAYYVSTQGGVNGSIVTPGQAACKMWSVVKPDGSLGQDSTGQFTSQLQVTDTVFPLPPPPPPLSPSLPLAVCPANTWSATGLDTDNAGGGCTACPAGTATSGTSRVVHESIAACHPMPVVCPVNTWSASGMDTDGQGTGCTVCNTGTTISGTTAADHTGAAACQAAPVAAVTISGCSRFNFSSLFNLNEAVVGITTPDALGRTICDGVYVRNASLLPGSGCNFFVGHNDDGSSYEMSFDLTGAPALPAYQNVDNGLHLYFYPSGTRTASSTAHSGWWAARCATS
jgi:hypothetical protein